MEVNLVGRLKIEFNSSLNTCGTGGNHILICILTRQMCRAGTNKAK